MKYDNTKRFRLLSLHTPWFFITAFYWPRYGDSWFVLEIFEPIAIQNKWSICKPRWEDAPMDDYFHI